MSALGEMSVIGNLARLLIFPSGLFMLAAGMWYQWAERKMVARLQNRIGPRWFQPLADVVKLMSKEEVVPTGVNRVLFVGLPVVALAGAMTAALYVPILGLKPVSSFTGDLVVAIYLLSLPTLCAGLAGANTGGRYSMVGATRALTQVFAYEAPFLMAMLGPAMVAASWQVSEISAYSAQHWLLLTMPLSFIVAMVGLMGKLELPPFDAPEAETEIVAGALTEYSGRGLAIFQLARMVEMVVGLTLVAAFFLSGLHHPLDFLIKTLALLLVIVILSVLLTRFRIDQVVRWWRVGALLVLAQLLIGIVYTLYEGML